MQFHVLEKLINLHEGYRRLFRVDGNQLLLMQEHGELFIIESHCPHKGHPLLEALTDGNELRCPLHGYRFSLQSGQLLQASGEACRGLKVYPVSYEGRDVGVVL